MERIGFNGRGVEGSRGIVSTLATTVVRVFRGFCAVFLYLAIVVRYLVGKALGLAFLGFLILAVLQAPHPPKWDTWAWVVLLRKFADPLLMEIDAVLEWPEAKPFYPLGLAIATSFAMFSVDTRLWQVESWLRKAAKRGGPRQTYRSPLGPNAPPLAAPRTIQTPASVGSTEEIPR